MNRPDLSMLPEEIMKYIEELENRLGEQADLYWEFDHWDCTYPEENISEMLDMVGTFDVAKIGRAKQLPAQWVAGIPTTFDDNGDIDDWEHQWFDTEEEAEAAVEIASSVMFDKLQEAEAREGQDER